MEMIEKYRTGGWGNDLIERIEIERETAASVWIRGNRHAKQSEYLKYFDNWDDAKAQLMEKAERKLKSCRRSLERAQGEYGNVKGLKNPCAD
jgi:hypothetical protein